MKALDNDTFAYMLIAMFLGVGANKGAQLATWYLWETTPTLQSDAMTLVASVIVIVLIVAYRRRSGAPGTDQ